MHLRRSAVCRRAVSTLAALALTLVAAPTAIAADVVFPEDDAYVSEASPRKNFGSASTLAVDASSLADLDAHLEFLVPPQDGAIVSATLRLYVTNGSTDGVRIRATERGWSQSKITWSNRPAVTSGNLASATLVTQGEWITLDVTDAVTAGERAAFQLDALGPDGTDFAAMESTRDPRLVITTATAAEQVPAVPTTTFGPVSATAPTIAYVTPEMHGARGDDVADDSVEFQAALNAAAGRTLWIPADKTYYISQTLSVPSNTTVTGAGRSSVVRFTWTGTANGGSNLRSAGTSASNIHLSNFVLQGGGDGYPSGLNADNPAGLVPLVKLIKVTNFSLKRMELRNAEGLSVSYTGSSNGVFQHNHVHHSGRDGITGYRNTSANVTDILIDQNLIEKVGDDAIAINGLVPGQDLAPPADGSSPLPKRITITDNVIRGWGDSLPVGSGDVLGRGIALNGLAGALVQGNDISHPNSTGILLTGCNPHICEGSSTDWYSTDVRLLGNVIAYATGGSRPGAIAVLKTKRAEIRLNRASYSAPFDFAGAVSSTISENVESYVVR